jgi:myotubularin-related protein 1/2
MAGYGYENTSNYSNTTLQFCNIGNIHAVRDSYLKICALCNGATTSDLNWNVLVEDTRWLSHIRLILAASWETAYWAHIWRMPVLVHCSHGWDRTSQVVALAQLLLDPHSEDKTVGAAPISTGNADDSQVSPIFLQFLDCVYQIVTLYPDCFEFNTKYLLELSSHISSCRFGSMLCDTEREREALAGIRQRTYAVWDFLDSKPMYRNPLFKGGERNGVLLMPLPTLLRNVQLWQERHCQFGPKVTMSKASVGQQALLTTSSSKENGEALPI